jgi:hypothetical protein
MTMRLFEVDAALERRLLGWWRRMSPLDHFLCCAVVFVTLVFGLVLSSNEQSRQSEPAVPDGLVVKLDTLVKAQAASVGGGLTISPELKAKQAAALAPIRRCAEIVDKSMFVTKVVTSETVECMRVLDIFMKTIRP